MKTALATSQLVLFSSKVKKEKKNKLIPASFYLPLRKRCSPLISENRPINKWRNYKKEMARVFYGCIRHYGCMIHNF